MPALACPHNVNNHKRLVHAAAAECSAAGDEGSDQPHGDSGLNGDEGLRQALRIVSRDDSWDTSAGRDCWRRSGGERCATPRMLPL